MCCHESHLDAHSPHHLPRSDFKAHPATLHEIQQEVRAQRAALSLGYAGVRGCVPSPTLEWAFLLEGQSHTKHNL